MLLDLGEITKGCAVDHAAAVLLKSGVERALFNFGYGLMSLGGQEESKGWRIGIKDPNNPKKIVQVINLRNQAIATSETYEKYRSASAGDLLAHHLIDPEIVRPGRLQFHGLTVFGSKC